MSHASDVREFQQKFGQILNDSPRHLTYRKLQERIECMQEELTEFSHAAVEQDLPAMADALVDLVYFALGTANMMGLPWEDLWTDVHRANMAKVRGVTHRGHAVDCAKPPGWMGPQTEKILRAYGYDEEVHSLEENHCDDPGHADHLRRA